MAKTGSQLYHDNGVGQYRDPIELVDDEEIQMLLFRPAGTLNAIDMNHDRPLDGRICWLASALLLLLPTYLPASEGQTRSRTFELTYKATVRNIPEGTKNPRPLAPAPADRPESDCPSGHDRRPDRVTIGRETRFGNQSVNVRVDHPTAPVTVMLTVLATRRESAGCDEVSEQRRSSRISQA